MVEAISTMGEHEHELKGAKAVSFAVSESCESCGAVLHHQQQQQQPQFQHSDIKIGVAVQDSPEHEGVASNGKHQIQPLPPSSSSSSSNRNQQAMFGLLRKKCYLPSCLSGLFRLPKALRPVDRNQHVDALDINIFSIKKTIMTLTCLLVIIMQNSVQLKFLVRHRNTFLSQFSTLQFSLGIFSIMWSSLIGLILMYASRDNLSDVFKQRKLDFLNNASMIMLFLLCIFNIFLVVLN